MHAFLHEKQVICLLGTALLLFGITPNAMLAGDGSGAEEKAPVKAAPAKADSSIALTDHERLLLDRIEQLEKRVAELEAKGSLSAAAPIETSGAQPAPTESAVPPKPSGPVGAAPVALQVAGNSKPGSEKPQKAEPFAFADFTWLNGNARTKESPVDTKFFTPEIRADVDYVYDFNHPKDDSIGGSSEVFRSNEVHVTQLGVGGDFHYDNVRARLMTQFGLYSQTTPRNDASPSRGQWNLADAYRYVSEAYGGYHFNALHGINVDAGIFMS